MVANILDGKAVAKKIISQLAKDVGDLDTRPPCLAVILIGNNPASEIYVRNKQRACAEIGIESLAHRHSDKITQAALLSLLHKLNQDPNVDGILVQLPLPSHLDNQAILEALAPNKDVDGFHPYNLGRLAQGTPALPPCTPRGIIKLIKHYDLTIKGQHAVMVGASNIVGRPMALELLAEQATVTVCHRATKNLYDHIKQADILISAVGQRDIVDAEQIKPGAIVIDVGINHLEDGTISGDINQAMAKTRASWLTPVPGGIGPMTIAQLLLNTWTCYQSLGIAARSD